MSKINLEKFHKFNFQQNNIKKLDLKIFTRKITSNLLVINLYKQGWIPCLKR